MHWGVSRSPVDTTLKKYHQWQTNRNLKSARKFDSKANNIHFQSSLNPLYVLDNGLSNVHMKRARNHKAVVDFEEAIREAEKSSKEAVSNFGKKLVSDLQKPTEKVIDLVKNVGRRKSIVTVETSSSVSGSKSTYHGKSTHGKSWYEKLFGKPNAKENTE